MRPSGLSWAWLVVWTTCLLVTAVPVSGRRSGLRTLRRRPVATPIVQSDPPEIRPQARAIPRVRIRPVIKHVTRTRVTGKAPDQVVEVTTEGPELTTTLRVSRPRVSPRRTRHRPLSPVTPSATARAVLRIPASTVTETTTKAEAPVTNNRLQVNEASTRRTRLKLPPRSRVRALVQRIVDAAVTKSGHREVGRLRGRVRGGRMEEMVGPEPNPIVADTGAKSPVTIIPPGNPSRVKLSRTSTRRRQLLRPLRPLHESGHTPIVQDTGEMAKKGLRTHRVAIRPRHRERVPTATQNQTSGLIHSIGDKSRVKLTPDHRVPGRRIRLTTPTPDTRPEEEVTRASRLGRRRHHSGGVKRIKTRTTTTTTTTTTPWPPSVAFPTQGPQMGGNPFEGILSKSDLFKMGRRLHPDWWQDTTVGECPGEHLIVHHSLYFHCARRNHNDLSDPYGKCIHGDSACKQENPLSKCCYNGCGDICLKPEKLIHEFCYEAMGSVRYQPGEEFMHGEWWCKCDPKKKSYQEMCTRLKCSLDDLVDDNSQESKESSEESSETSEEESSEESSEEDSSEEKSSEEDSSEEKSSEEDSSEEKSKDKKPPKCKKGSKGCRKRKVKPRCKKGKGQPGCRKWKKRPTRKCKKGKCKWHKKTKPVTKWKRGGHGSGRWKNHKVTNVKKHKFTFKNSWKGKWKPRKWKKSWRGTWKKKWIKRKWQKPKWRKWKKPSKWRWGYKKRSWKKTWWRNKKHGHWNKKWHKKTSYRIVTKRWKVKWTLGKGTCEQIWVMGCSGLTLNEKLALNLILAIRESHYKWPENFVNSTTNSSTELTSMLKTAYLDNYYYGGFNDSINWVFWVNGLRRACNTSVGDGIYPVTWSTSLKKWQEATIRELNNNTDNGSLTYAKNWTTLWFDPLRDTCERNVWLHFTERRQEKNVGEFELTWHSAKTIELCTTNMELGWLMRFVPMYRRYVWTLILLGSKQGWHGPPQYKILGSYWKYGARRYDYVLRSCYNIWSWGCNGTSVNETWAREWVKYSTTNGFTWAEDFMPVNGDVDEFMQKYGLDWDGLSVLNGTDSEKLNWALWYNAYNTVCNATIGERSEEKLVDVLQEWKATKESEFASSTNITISGNWSDLWRYTFRHSCITKLKFYRRFAYDLIVRKGRHSMMGYWMQKYMKGDWNTAYFQQEKTLKVKEYNWESYMDLSFFDGYGSCIDTWRPGCNTTLTNSSYLDMWHDLLDRAGFQWSANFTMNTNNSFVEELADKYIPDRNTSDVTDYNWAFWFDGWQAMCNASVEDGDRMVNWTSVLYRWASDWTGRLDEDRSVGVDWMKLWIEPLSYMCNYTGINDTVSEDFTQLLTMSPEEGLRHVSTAVVAREIRYEKVIERRMDAVRKQKRYYQYNFNYGLCINVWTSVCNDDGLNMTEVDGLLQCLQRSTPALNFMNYTADEVRQLLATASLMNLTNDESQLLDGLKNKTIPDVNELVWKLWVGGWKRVCSKTEAKQITMDEVLAALEETFEENQILQIGGTVDEWKKAWIKPWVGPCKGDSFSCEYQQEYEEMGPMTWNYECTVYLNDTIQSFNWTSAGNDWKEKCGIDDSAKFDWTDIEEVMKVWTDLCNAGTNGGGVLPYTEDKWDEDFDIACHKLKVFRTDDDGNR